MDYLRRYPEFDYTGDERLHRTTACLSCALYLVLRAVFQLREVAEFGGTGNSEKTSNVHLGSRLPCGSNEGKKIVQMQEDEA